MWIPSTGFMDGFGRDVEVAIRNGLQLAGEMLKLGLCAVVPAPLLIVPFAAAVGKLDFKESLKVLWGVATGLMAALMLCLVLVLILVIQGGEPSFQRAPALFWLGVAAIVVLPSIGAYLAAREEGCSPGVCAGIAALWVVGGAIGTAIGSSSGLVRF